MKYASISHTFLVLVVSAGLCSAQIRMERSVLAGGATRASNTTHTINGTIGQTIIGSVKNTTQQAALGFWYEKKILSTSVERFAASAPSTIVLEQNYPNPANTVMAIRFSIPTSRHVLLLVTDALGRTLKNVADAVLESGSYKSDVMVGDLPSGTYFYRLYAGDEQLTRKFIVLR